MEAARNTDINIAATVTDNNDAVATGHNTVAFACNSIAAVTDHAQSTAASTINDIPDALDYVTGATTSLVIDAATAINFDSLPNPRDKDAVAALNYMRTHWLDEFSEAVGRVRRKTRLEGI
jgi:hypothetical protein